MAKFKCKKCSRSFDSEQGLRLHHKRKHTLAGKSWGSSKHKRKSANGRGTIKNKLRQVLADSPEGLRVTAIVAAMKRRGWRPKGDGTGYVCQTAASDPGITRVERGVYRLKENVLAELQSKAKPTAVIEPEITDMPREALLIRIEQLERQLHATEAAHLSYIKEMSNVG
jgi:hypothetical protein